MFFITIVLLFTVPLGSEYQTLDSVMLLLTKLNVFTATLTIAITPITRDVVGGLTLFADRPFKVGDLIEVKGITPKSGGHVLEFRLRTTVLKMLDESTVYIPNGMFMVHPVVNYSRMVRIL